MPTPDTPFGRLVRELSASLKQHMDDDRRAFASLEGSIGRVSRQIDDAAEGLQGRLGRLETDRIKRDAVREYADDQEHDRQDRKTVRENIGASRRAWVLGVFVAFVTVAGVVVSALAVVLR